jgi:hypothetical protein
MTIKPTKAAAPGPRFDAARRYSVKLNRIVEHPPGSKNRLSPAHAHEMRGDVAQLYDDAITSFDLIAEPADGGA